MATTAPSLCSALTTATLSAGNTSAMTSSMPTSRATDRATVWLSPVSSIGRRPSRRSSATAAAEVGLTLSATSRRARTWPSQTSSAGVTVSGNVTVAFSVA
jgi:hypothetical protein